MSFRKVCFVVLALCALLLFAGCAAQEPLFFVTDNAVYALPADGEPQLVYESDGYSRERSFYLVGHTPYLLDGETLYRVERKLTVTRLFDLEGANNESVRRGYQSSRHFAVTVKDGVVTAYYMDHVNAGGAASLNQLGEATQTIVAKSSDGTVRRYDVPMRAKGGFTVTDTAILTTQSCALPQEGKKKARVYIGLYQTDLATGETELLQSMRKYDTSNDDVAMTGEAAMHLDQSNWQGNLQLQYLWGSTEQTHRMIRPSYTQAYCQYGDVDAFSDGSDWIRLYQAGSSRIRPYQVGTQIAIIERAEDEAWAEGANETFAMTADDTRVAVSVMAESLEEFYVYVVDRETGQVTHRLRVPATPEKYQKY